MARNEEKQQGKLNRLWLQKEREEGRLKDGHQRRPKLSTLNSASSVKKWIPSIKNDIEYYLQQSQLPHYPERKIAEFQLHIEALEREYKSFIAKLRVLDPACKHKPWTPRAYCKRRADTQDAPRIVKNPRPCEPHDGSSQLSEGESDLTSNKTSAPERQGPPSHSETKFYTPLPTNPISESSEAVCAHQDRPLAFDQTKLAVAAAAFRGPSVQRGSSQTQSLARVLQSGLPNLVNASLKQTFSTHSTDAQNDGNATVGSEQKSVVQDRKSDCEAAERIHGKSSSTGTEEERTGHVLGLDCYSSSDEECDT
ncbi:uncharacterized protein si:dkey-86e18.1 [Epinephelus fuscoguttatus]|uniref:uncharacterized protein si:dkey-86e18.1 n=1 Tax=Epinephelus fuscoguttatus TaxID=293821 RepID=UPI0020D11755|nr:uncharacterized protein si:dkey-86e18.1 [Epinephelus fuscoguttatus]XP_049444173.1 uncharacterized protein si:dkey-86e18.1 [Epinephelus fuscoguttatus]